MTQYDEPPVSGWATGGIMFAATLLFIVGIFQGIAGISAIFEDQFYVVTRNYVFDLDVTAWGWIHLLLGILLLVAGWALFARKPWAARLRDRPGVAGRDRELLLHPVLPVVVAARDRALDLGDLVADQARRAPRELKRRPRRGWVMPKPFNGKIELDIRDSTRTGMRSCRTRRRQERLRLRRRRAGTSTSSANSPPRWRATDAAPWPRRARSSRPRTGRGCAGSRAATFAMGSERHYPEEAPVREATVGGFWMDEHPVTNLEFTPLREGDGPRDGRRAAPDADRYPGAQPELLFAGSVVFQKLRRARST